MAKDADSMLRWPSRGGNRAGGRVGERLVAIFFLGVVVFSPLVIRIFDRGIGVTVFGVPLLYCYLFGAWAVLIGLIASAMESLGEPRGRRATEPSRPQPNSEGRKR